MKLRLVLVIGLYFLTFSCSKTQNLNFESALINKSKVYLIYRGTNTKEGFLARDFNIKDTLSSHVGFAVNNGLNWQVYHILNDNKDSTDYKNHSFKYFLSKEKNKVFYYSLWEIVSLTKNDVCRLKKFLEEFKTIQIKFDRGFIHNNDSTKLYCSEFICRTLKKVDSVKFNFVYHKRKLKGVYKAYFRKDILEYYPVDMFQYDSNFKKIYDWRSQ